MQMLKIKKLLGTQIDNFDNELQTLKDFYGISLDIPKIKISNDILLKQMLSIKRKIIRQQRQYNM